TSHTEDWQPRTLFSSVLKAGSSGASFLPSSMMYSYLSSQESKKENFLIISCFVSTMDFKGIIFSEYLPPALILPPVHRSLPGCYKPQMKPWQFPGYKTCPSVVVH